jgi:malate synthase
LVELARTAFDARLKQPNQLQAHRDLKEVELSRLLTQMLEPPQGAVTELGVRKNLRVSLIYLESWLRGIGCVPIDHLMEDAATAEISRAQIWQWLRHPRARLSDHRALTETDIRAWMDIEQEKAIREASPLPGHFFDRARSILEDLIYDNRFSDFLTLAAYPEVTS